MKRVDEVWKESAQVRVFLEGIRGAIPFFEAQLQTMMRLLEGLPVSTFLDLGCGDGILSAELLRRYPKARGVLLDFSEPMLEKARESLCGQSEGLDFVKADFSDKNWPERAMSMGLKSFDVIVSGYAIHHQGAAVKRTIFKAIYGLLNPGGIFINIDHVASHSERIREISNNLFIENLRSYHKARGKPGGFEEVRDIFIRRMAEEAGVLSTLGSQLRWLSEGGFVDVDCSFKSFELALFSGRKPGG